MIYLLIYLSFEFHFFMILEKMVERATYWESLGPRAHGWDLSKGKDEIGARWSECSRAIEWDRGSVERVLSGN